MTKWIPAHLPVIGTVMAAVALIGAILAIVAVIVVARRIMRVVTERTRPEFDPRGELRLLSDQLLTLDNQLRDIRAEFSEQKHSLEQAESRVTTLVKLLARDRQQSLTVRLRNDAVLEKLNTIYKEGLQRMGPTIRALGSIRSHVDALLVAVPSDSAQFSHVRSVVEEFRALTATVSELETRPHLIATAINVETQLKRLYQEYRSGTVDVDSYLRDLLDFTIPSELGFPDPEVERTRLENMPEATRNDLLAFVDSVTELRDQLRDVAEVAGGSECDEIIRTCGDFLDSCGIRLVDVARGTVFDARLHDLYAAIPSVAASPETIIGVRRLGQRRGGELVRKPQVLVAAAC